MAENGQFDPAAHLTDLRGNQYLEVKWRLAWLRDAEPNAFIETELKDHQEGFALFRALVTLPSGGSATGWGAETQSDFGDYIEKAETKALGRALAALGFGTQFCMDFDEGGSVTDSPVSSRRTAPAVRGGDESKPNTRWAIVFSHFSSREDTFAWLNENMGTSKIASLTMEEWSELKGKLESKDDEPGPEDDTLVPTPSEIGRDPGPQEPR